MDANPIPPCAILTGLLIRRMCLGKSIGRCTNCNRPLCDVHAQRYNQKLYCPDHAIRIDDNTTSDPTTYSGTTWGTHSSGTTEGNWSGGGGGFSGGGASGSWASDSDSDSGKSSSSTSGSSGSSHPGIVPTAVGVAAVTSGQPSKGAAKGDAEFTEEDFQDFEKMASGEEIDPGKDSFDS